MVGASPSVSNRIARGLPRPRLRFEPERYLEPREEDRANPWTWIPFGAGRHRCVGAAFAMMQLKAIFSRPAARLGVRAGPAGRHLPERPVEDGRPAPTAVRGPLSAAPDVGRGRAGRRLMRVSSTSTCARATGCASPRRPACSSSGKDHQVTMLDDHARRGPPRRGRSRRSLLPHTPVDRGRRSRPDRHDPILPSAPTPRPKGAAHAVVPPQ